MRRPIGYYELNGTRHAVFSGTRIPDGATFHANEAVPGPPPPSREEEARREIAARLPEILVAIKDRADFTAELQRRVKEAADSKLSAERT